MSVYKDGMFGLTVNGSNATKRRNITGLFKRFENLVQKSTRKGLDVRGISPILVRVYEDGCLSNSGTYTNQDEAVYVMSVFLEDFLPDSIMKRMYRKFFGYSMKLTA